MPASMSSNRKGTNFLDIDYVRDGIGHTRRCENVEGMHCASAHAERSLWSPASKADDISRVRLATMSMRRSRCTHREGRVWFVAIGSCTYLYLRNAVSLCGVLLV